MAGKQMKEPPEGGSQHKYFYLNSRIPKFGNKGWFLYLNLIYLIMCVHCIQSNRKNTKLAKKKKIGHDVTCVQAICTLKSCSIECYLKVLKCENYIYLLTPYSRVLFEKLTGSAASQ
jgi:hypothetical protein